MEIINEELIQPRAAKPKRVTLKRATRRRIFRRKMWRKRAEEAMIRFSTWPTGKPARELHETVMLRAIGKVRQWFPAPRSTQVLSVLQRRATQAYYAAQAHAPSEAMTLPPALELTPSGRR